MSIRHRLTVLSTALLLGVAVASVVAGQAEARDNRPADNGVRCLYYDPATGEMNFYLPGQNIFVFDANGEYVMLTCGSDGNWYNPLQTPSRPRGR
jgi:hypothetical protein